MTTTTQNQPLAKSALLDTTWHSSPLVEDLIGGRLAPYKTVKGAYLDQCKIIWQILGHNGYYKNNIDN